VLLFQQAIRLSERFGRGRGSRAGLLVALGGVRDPADVDPVDPLLAVRARCGHPGRRRGPGADPGTDAILEGLPPEKPGVASALNDVTGEVGGALGIALFGSLLDSACRVSVTDGLDGVPPEVAEAVREAPAAAPKIAAQLGPQGDALLATVRDSVAEGWRTTALVAAGVAVIAAVVVAVRTPRTRHRAAA
jgi:hypothetical protein